MQATIHSIEPFDATVGANIGFTWNGNQIYKVRFIAKDNETGTTIYDETIETMKQVYTIPANSGLENGGYYVAYITVFDIDDNESDIQSMGVPFYCFTTPTFKLSVNDGDIIQSSTYELTLTYSQEEDEPLDSWNIILYNHGRTELMNSGTVYNTDEMSYIIQGLDNSTQYYVRATGTTLHGIVLDTNYILITASYVQKDVFTTLELNNQSSIGAIQIKSNIISTEGIPEKDITYIDDNYADLTDNSVTFNSGFYIDEDFTYIQDFYAPSLNNEIIYMTNNDNTLTIRCLYREGIFENSNGKQCCIEFIANSAGLNYVIYSNYVNIPSDDQQLRLYIQREGFFYNINLTLINKE